MKTAHQPVEKYRPWPGKTPHDIVVAQPIAQSSKASTVADSNVPIPESKPVAAGEPSPRVSWQAAGRALRHRNFQLFFGGQLISLIGTWMQTVAQSWLVYRLTGSGLLLGAVGFASQIPVFLVAPLGGITADRANRQRIVIATQTASMILAFILAALTLSGKVQVWHIFVLAALLGVVNAFDIPGRQSFLVDMVGKDDLMNAIALNSSMFNGARVIGPAVAGVLVARLGEGWCFFANAVSYIAVIAGLMMMRVHAPARVSAKTSPWKHIVEGFQFVNRTAPIRALLILLGLVSVTGMPYVVLMPIFADKILHNGGQEFASLIRSHDLGAVRLGILMGAAGVGALLGALTLAVRSGVKGLGRWVTVCCAGFGVSLMLFAFSKSFWLSVALLLPVGYFIMLQMASSNTLIQVMVPDELRGRVMALYSMMFMGMAPVGALLGGALSDRLGAPLTVALGGLASVAGAWWFGVQLPKIRVEARRLIVAQAMAGGEPAEEMSAPVVEE
ncbi:MAG TPA: MFS transporter [Candidatus Sulfotelmatobacter sp.]|nr:MFS transporter [Candidatus Sulfotelmatobacter sp.]